LNAAAAAVVIDVLEHFRERAASVNPDYEYVLRDGLVHVGRYHWTRVSEELAEANNASDYPLQLEERRNGGSMVLNCVPVVPEPLGAGDVMITPAYAGIAPGVRPPSTSSNSADTAIELFVQL
jgi:hypothetical protein